MRVIAHISHRDQCDTPESEEIQLTATPLQDVGVLCQSSLGGCSIHPEDLAQANCKVSLREDTLHSRPVYSVWLNEALCHTDAEAQWKVALCRNLESGGVATDEQGITVESEICESLDADGER